MYALCKGYIVYTFYVSNIRFLNKKGKNILYICVYIYHHKCVHDMSIISLFAFVYLKYNIVFGSAPLYYYIYDVCVCNKI